jgi:alcohol dehydrogenase class IV
MGCQHYVPTDGGAHNFSVFMPRLTFGRGCLAEVGLRCSELAFRRVAVFTDPGLRDSALIAQACDSLKAASIDYAIHSEIRVEPCNDTVQASAGFLAGGNFDALISIGGGSVIDSAKAALLLAAHGGTVRDYLAPPVGNGQPVPGPVLPHIACPTTAGTGSECTPISVIRINELETKFVVCSNHLMPTVALVDPQCCDTLPERVVASSGFDLLSHALECYTARAYTQHAHVEKPSARIPIQGANPFSDMAAREALDIAGRYLVRGVRDNSDHEARDQLMWGATLAGMAFGNAGTHLPHALSYGVTHLMADITTEGYPVPSPFVPHGISVIVTSPAVFRYTAEAAPDRHLDAATALGANLSGATPDDAGEVLAGRMIELMKDTDMPNGLGGVGFADEHVSALAASAERQKRAILNAPRDSNLVDLENIYRAGLAYW